MLADIPFSRRVFARAALGVTLANVIEAQTSKPELKRPPKVLAVIAHPDDEYHFAVNPIVLGKGRTMFEGLKKQIDLKLVKSRAFKNGNVVLVYEPK